MTRIPEPRQTPAGPVYEGRLLDRVDEEIVDQGAPFDLRTLLSRRGILGIVGLGAGAAMLAACAPITSRGGAATRTASATASSATLPSAEIPDETAGPFPGDGSNGPDVLEQSGIVRSDIRSSLDGGTSARGVAMTLTLTILDMAAGDAPFAGVAMYVWHCDATGGYSMYSDGIEDETYLRGVQIADAAGRASFTSIFPGCYAGRWPHVHFEVYPDQASITDAANAISTSQVAFTQASSDAVYALAAYDGSARNLAQLTLENDTVFGADRGDLQLATITGDPHTGYTVELTVRVDTSTAPAAHGGGGRP